MNPTVNMILTLEKELELEHKGFRRTRRWIGDACQVTDARWYQGEVGPVSETNHLLSEVSRAGETKPRRERRSILARLLPLPRARRQPAFTEC